MGKTEVQRAAVMTGALLAAGVGHARQPENRPNIIHIMVDDLGWRDLSIYGSETFHTPNIDALAARGMRFSNSYSSSPLCSPTRASVITGQSCGRTNYTAPHGHMPQVVLNPVESDSAGPSMPMTIPQTASRVSMDIPTIGKIFKQAGYHTAFIGKWHLGHDPFIPENFGFDVVWGGRGTPGPPAPGFFGPWPEEANFPPTEGNPNADDVMGDAAVRFIEEKAGEPFFIALWLYNVHAPFQGKNDYIAEARELAEAAWYQRSAIMASMVRTLDDNVGKVVAELERQGILDNTLIIFTSDNGGNMYDRPEGENPTDNYPLRAGKGNTYEGGIRVPYIASWPDVIPFDTVSDTVNVSYDFYPTVLDILGKPVPEGHVLDGVSLLPAFRGEPMERGPIYIVFPHTVFATGNYANIAIREGKWKLLRFFHTGRNQEDEFELYDLSADPGETRNLATLYPEVTQRLSAQMAHHIEDAGTLLPRRNPHYDPNYIMGGFQMVGGGIMVTGGPNNVGVTSRESSVTLRYPVPEGQVGEFLELNFLSNCAVSLVAGPGETPVFGKPVIVRPNLENHRVHLPLGTEVSSGVVTVVIDLVQPGRVMLSNAVLRRGDEIVTLGEPEVDGWRAGRESVGLRVDEDGALVVHSTMEDPWVEFDLPEPLSAGAPFTLRFEILADGPGDLRLYDRATAGRGFTPQAVVDVRLAEGGRWVDVGGQLLSGAPLHAIRINPPNRAGISRLRNIRIEDANGRVLARWFAK